MKVYYYSTRYWQDRGIGYGCYARSYVCDDFTQSNKEQKCELVSILRTYEKFKDDN